MWWGLVAAVLRDFCRSELFLRVCFVLLAIPVGWSGLCCTARYYCGRTDRLSIRFCRKQNLGQTNSVRITCRPTFGLFMIIHYRLVLTSRFSVIEAWKCSQLARPQRTRTLWDHRVNNIEKYLNRGRYRQTDRTHATRNKEYCQQGRKTIGE